MKIIGIIGKKRSGKDTLATFFWENYRFLRYSLADPIKEACKAMFGFTDAQCWGNLKEVIDPNWGITPREVLQIMGTEVAQYYFPEKLPALAKIGRNFWTHKFNLWYQNELLSKDFKGVVVPDVRFLHEVVELRKHNAYIIKVNRPGLDNTDTHASEMELEGITDIDFVVENNGTIEELYKKVLKHFRILLSKEVLTAYENPTKSKEIG